MLVTEWKAYWNPDWQRLASQLAGRLLLDGRNIYDPRYVASMGLHYRGIGRRADPESRRACHARQHRGDTRQSQGKAPPMGGASNRRRHT